MTLDEQETTVTQLRNGDTYVYTANPVHLRALRKKVTEGRAIERDGDETQGNFLIPLSEFDPLKGFKRRGTPMSPEQKEANAARLAQARVARSLR